MNRASILEMSRGAIMERVDSEMGKVVDNILDPNTLAAKKRKLTVTIEFLPDEERRQIAVQTTAKSTLVPTAPVFTALYVTAKPGNGEMAVVEMVPQVPGQFTMDGEEQDEPTILRIAK